MRKAMLILVVLFGLGVGGLLSACGSTSATASRDSAVLNLERDYLILVNEDVPYEFGGEYDRQLQADLIQVPDVYGEATRVERAAYVSFSQLQAALVEKGVTIGLFSAYRTEKDQQWVYDNYAQKEGWGDKNKVMLPGHSEHHTGLMINFLVWYELDGEWQWMTLTADRLSQYPELRVIYDVAADYGFIERYPVGRESSTGVPGEPYELRFVGSAGVAHAIMDGHYTLEEYLAAAGPQS